MAHITLDNNSNNFDMSTLTLQLGESAHSLNALDGHDTIYGSIYTDFIQAGSGNDMGREAMIFYKEKEDTISFMAEQVMINYMVVMETMSWLVVQERITYLEMTVMTYIEPISLVKE